MSSEVIKISFGGDLMCLKEETEAVLRKCGQPEYGDYVGALKPLFADSDYSIANLETPIDPSQGISDEAVRFNTPKEFAVALKEVGFDFLSTANNHCLDRGISGLEGTIDVLDSLKFAHAGTYKRNVDSDGIVVSDVRGIKIAIVCSTFGTNSDSNGVMLPEKEEWRVDLLKGQIKRRRLPVSDDMSNGNFRTYIADCVSPAAISNAANLPYLTRIENKIRKAREASDFVIAMPHVGGQFNPGPASYAKFIVERMRVAGAHMVIAGHPHVTQRCERWCGGSFVAYSLGNLCFTPGVGFFVQNVLSEYGIVLHAYVGKSSKKLERITFDVVKSIVDDDGCAHSIPVVDLLAKETNVARRDRLLMENEAVVNRFRGSVVDVSPQREYEF